MECAVTFWRRWLSGDAFVSWNQQVQSLKTDRPLALPPIKALKAKPARARKKAKIAAFRQIGK